MLNFTKGEQKNLFQRDHNIIAIESNIKTFEIEIIENDIHSKITLNNFLSTYDNESKDLSVKIDSLSLNINLMSTLLLYFFQIESPLFDQYRKIIIDENKEYLLPPPPNQTSAENKKPNKENPLVKKIIFEINTVNYSLQAEDNIITYSFQNIKGLIFKQVISISFIGPSLFYQKENEDESKRFNVIKTESETQINMDIKKDLLTIRINSPKIHLDFNVMDNMNKSLHYLMEQIDLEIILCKIDLEIENLEILIEPFKLNIYSASFKNFSDNTKDVFFFTITSIDFNDINNGDNKILTEENINIEINIANLKDVPMLFDIGRCDINVSKEIIKNMLLLASKKNSIKENDNSQSQLANLHYQKPKKNNKENEKENDILSIKIKSNLSEAYINLLFNNEKKTELNLVPIHLKCDLLIDNKDNQKEIKDKKIQISFDELGYKYYDKENEISLFKRRNNNTNNMLLNNSNISLSIDKSLLNIDKNSQSKHGIEINLNNSDEIQLNLNQNEIYIREDIILDLLNTIGDLLIEAKEIIPKKEEENKNKENMLKKIGLNINEIQLKYDSFINKNKSLYILINKLNANYNIEGNELLYGNINLFLNDFLLAIISQNNNFRKLIYTKDNFLSLKANIKKDIISSSISINKIFFNISYQDLIFLNKISLLLKSSFLKSEKLQQVTEKLKQIQPSSDNNDSDQKCCCFNEDLVFSIKTNIKDLYLVLIDNYPNNSFHPFVNINLSKVCVIIDPKKTIHSSLYLAIFSYNYLACEWEPTIENCCIRGIYIKKKDNKLIYDSMKIEIYQLIINLSDIFISSTITSLNNLLKCFEAIKKKNNFIENSESALSFLDEDNSLKGKNLQLASNSCNQIVNYSGSNVTVIHNNNQYQCPQYSSIDLAVTDEIGINQKQKKISNNEILIKYNKDSQIAMPNDRIISKRLEINEYQYLIIENIISKERQITTIIYSPIIFKNKTNYDFQIKLSNNQLGNCFVLLNHNSLAGIPLTYYKKSTTFSLKIIKRESIQTPRSDVSNKSLNMSNISINQNDTFNLGEVIEASDKLQKKLKFDNIELFMRLQEKISYVKSLIISPDYTIVNCLPCPIQIECKDQILKVHRCSQCLLDISGDANLEIRIIITSGKEAFYSDYIDLSSVVTDVLDTNNNKGFITFKNENKDLSFQISMLAKPKDYCMKLIIYSVFLVNNDSGLELGVDSRSDNIRRSFQITDNIYLLSNKINLDDTYLQFSSESFKSSQIIINDIINTPPYYIFSMENENDGKYYSLILKKNMSSIALRNNPNFKENILSMVFYVLPKSRITNLIKTKKIVIRNYNDKKQFIVIPPFDQINFNFFCCDISNKEKSDCNLELGMMGQNDNKCSKTRLFNNFDCGIYTYFIEEFFINVEIKNSAIDGVKEIFIKEGNFDNGKIIVNNLSNIQFNICQTYYEKYPQTFPPNSKQILKIYNQRNNVPFIIDIKGNKFIINFNSFKEEYTKEIIDNKYVLIKESNGVKMKITLYNKSDYTKENKSITENIFSMVKIDNIYISLISDNANKDKKFTNYERNELLLIYLKNFNINFSDEKSLGLLNKDYVKFNLFLENCEVYNQISKRGKFACVFQNIQKPFFSIDNENVLYKNDNVSKIDKLFIKMSKLKISLDPEIILETLNFFNNINYRLGNINLYVDDIFLKPKKNYKNISTDNSNRDKITIYYGNQLKFPPINIDFELTEIKFDQLLKEKTFFSSNFQIWVITGLVGSKFNIFLEELLMINYFGELTGLIFGLQNHYKGKMFSIIVNMSFKSLLGHINKLITSNNNEIDFECMDVIKNRIRAPKSFYGRFKYFSTYDDKVDNNINRINNEEYSKNKKIKQLICNEVLIGEQYVYFFSDKSLIIYSSQFEKINDILYEIIDNLRVIDSEIVVHFNEKNIDKNDFEFSTINCEDNNIANNVSKIIEKYINKNDQ